MSYNCQNCSSKLGNIRIPIELPEFPNYPQNIPIEYPNLPTTTTVILPDGSTIVRPTRGNLPNTNLPPIIMTNPNITNPCANFSCLAGNIVVNADGSCGCSQPSGEQPPNTTKIIDSKSGQIIYYQLPNNPVQQTGGIFDSITQTIKDNPMIALGGAAVLVFLVFGGSKK